MIIPSMAADYWEVMRISVDKLVSIPVWMLYDGMTVPNDIYAADRTRLLILKGNTLNESQIDAIKRYSAGEDMIWVSVETRRMILRHNLACEVFSREELEENTGYTEVKKETMSLLKKMDGLEDGASRNVIQTVSSGLSDQLESVSSGTILEIVNGLAPIDEYLQRHSVNVGLLNGLLGKWLGYPKRDVDFLVSIGLLHDFGKTALPASVLNVARPLSAVEFEVIKMHPIYSYNLLSYLPMEVRIGIRGHHEKRNSMGYPDRLSGDAIPITARITAVSDIYDAMVSRRVYKAPQNPFRIISQLVGLKETELDPLIVDVFAQHMPKELLKKPFVMSNGEYGVIHSLDPDDPEFPYVRIGKKVVKTDKDLYCVYMFHEDNEEANGF